MAWREVFPKCSPAFYQRKGLHLEKIKTFTPREREREKERERESVCVCVCVRACVCVRGIGSSCEFDVPHHCAVPDYLFHLFFVDKTHTHARLTKTYLRF